MGVINCYLLRVIFSYLLRVINSYLASSLLIVICPAGVINELNNVRSTNNTK